MAEHLTRGGDLLAEYGAGQSFFASPRGTLLTQGVKATLSPEAEADAWQTLPARARDLVTSAATADPQAIVTGAVPFERDQDAYLFVPCSVRRGGPLRPADVVRGPAQAAPRWHARHEPSPDGYAAAVAEAVRRFATTTLEKVVLARTVHLTASPPVDLQRLLSALAAGDPAGYTFAIDLPNSDPAVARTFVGASPELVVGRYGRTVVAHPYGGSATRGSNPAEDTERAQALLQSAKDRHEHAVVVDDVERLLRPYCRTLSVPREPELVSTGSMWHLATRIAGVLDDTATTALDLAWVLHPTPAVCGTPTELAYPTIAELEPFDRNCYAGLVGWTDASGDGEWVVAIRSAEVSGDELRLFAGAGIVEGSVPAHEVRETAAKFRTVLAAIGIDADL